MPAPEGYKIYWGYTPNTLTATHPSESAFNSPFVAEAGWIVNNFGTIECTLPLNFWHDNFYTSGGIYLRVVAFTGTSEGVKSAPQEILSYGKDMQSGLWGYARPLDDGNTYTAKSLGQLLGASQVTVFSPTLGKFQTINPNLTPTGITLTATSGVWANFPSTAGYPKVIKWCGQGWKTI